MDKRDLALSFADDPERYDLVRPGYPSAVLERLPIAARGRERQRVLEIGPGSGKLTQHLLDAGLQVTCVEPASAFVRFLKGKFEGKSNFRIVEATFEAFEGDRYDLVVSAQAFHWVGWEVGLPKIKNILAPGGHLALLWYSSKLLDRKICVALDSVYEKYPTVTARLPGSFTARWQDPPKQMLESGFFQRPSVFEHMQIHRYTSLEYKLLASTQSQYKMLSPSDRENLLNNAVRAIEQFGGFIEVEYQYFLYIARPTTIP